MIVMGQSVNDYYVGCICALEIELAAFQACMDEIHDQIAVGPGDDNAYTFGRVGKHNVVVGCLGTTGKVSVAAVAKDMSRTFPSMRFALMVGIGGGIWSEKVDVRLGDVVVGAVGPSPGVIQYDYGKTIQGEGLVQRGSLQKPPAVLLNAVTALKAKHRLGQCGFVHQLEQLSKHESDHIISIATRPDQDTDRLFQSDYVHSGGDTCIGCENDRTIDRGVRKTQRPQVHYGVIASGDQVMKDAEMRDQIMLRHDVICFEMEAAGLMDTFPSLAIRGISDYSDSHKNDAWQPYAATVAAAYAKDLLTTVSPVQIKKLSSAGRRKHLRDINNAFARGTTRVALHGLGGVGKTQIAVEYAYQYRQEWPIAPVIWIHASGPERFIESCTDIARRLKLPGYSDPQRDKTIILSEWLSNARSDWLLIIDNADDVRFVDESDHEVPASVGDHLKIAEFVSRFNNGKILITSRNLAAADKLVGDPEFLIEVGPMSHGEAVDLLRSKLPAGTNSESHLKDLAEELDLIPLAIIQAAAYMRQNSRTTLMQYLDIFRFSRRDRQILLEFENTDLRRDRKASNAILTTWEISFKQIKTDFPASAALLSVLSMFDRQGIPDYLISSDNLHYCDSEHLNSLSELEILQTISVLVGFSFITQGSDGKTFGLHRLVQFATRTWLDYESASEGFRNAAVSILRSAYPADPGGNPRTCAEIETHANALPTTYKDTLELSFTETELLYGRAVYNFSVLIHSSIAVEMNGKAMLWRKHFLGPFHSATKEAVSLQCILMNFRQEYASTINIGRGVLESYLWSSESEGGDTGEWSSKSEGGDTGESSSGEYRGIMQILEQVAQAHQNLGQLDEALQLLEGSGHNELHLLRASILGDLGRLEEAQTLKEEARDRIRDLVDVRKQTFGPHHKKTSEAMKQLGDLYVELDCFPQAKAVFTEILEAVTHCPALNERSRIKVMEDLAKVHSHLNEMDQAEGLLVEVLEWRRHSFGTDHSQTRISILHLGKLYFDMHDFVKAKPLFVELWDLSKSTPESKEASSLLALRCLVQIEEEVGDLVVAGALWDEWVGITIDSEGPTAEGTLIAMSFRALNLKKQGRLDEACNELSRILMVATEALGRNHDTRIFILMCLADCKEHLDELLVAESLWDQLVVIRTKSRGLQDEKTLGAMGIRALNLVKQECIVEALERLSETLTLATEALGEGHNITIAMQEALKICRSILSSSDENHEEDSEQDRVTEVTDSDEESAEDATQAQEAASMVQETTSAPSLPELRLIAFPTTLHRAHLGRAMAITSSPLQCLRGRTTFELGQEEDEQLRRTSSLDLAEID